MPFAIAPDGARLYFETHGEGEPLLLVMGQGIDHHGWDYVRERFTARHRVIVFDNRGTGRSDKPDGATYSTRGFAHDAIAVLDALGIERAHVFGISMGGRVAQWLGIDHGQRLGALVLGCTTPGNAHGVRRPPEIDALMAAVAHGADRAAAALRLMREYVALDWLKRHSDWLAAENARQLPPEHARQGHYAASEAHDAWARLPDITAPTLVVHGTLDRINVPDNATLLASRIPGAELSMIDGARHLFYVDYGHVALPQVLAFIARHALTPGTTI